MKTLRGSAQLVFDAVEGITNSVEHMHRNIAATPRMLTPGLSPSPRSHGLIASSVYATIRGVNGALRGAADGAFRLVPGGGSPQNQADIKAIAALNGVAGDHLEDTGNPLATAMTLLAAGEPLSLDHGELAAALPAASPHIVILVHGLALSELSWQRGDKLDIGRRLAAERGVTPLYLRYNTGRHISTNGREFAALLEQLCTAWPTQVQSVSLIGHSMGGLVIRSACWYAEREQADWLEQLQRVICLGTPHHGSPLEKAGHLLDKALLAIPYTAPLAFGRKRSAGIKDLRHGNLLDEDWQGHDPDSHGKDSRRSVPLLNGVDYFFAAATIGRDHQDPIGHVLGDLLVRLGSAVGEHADDLRRVSVRPENCRVFHEQHHFDLLDDEAVHQQILDWFGGPSNQGETGQAEAAEQGKDAHCLTR
jgi:pimeloyl-ACP methyl ester carboxylesterase